MTKTLYLIDGHSQMYRAYYAPFRDLTSPAGEPTRATYVFCTMLLRLLQERKPDYIAMAIDGPAEQLERRRIDPDYKVTRKPMPDDLPPQIDRILQIVRTIGVPVLEAEGHEADDILATAVERLAGPDVQVVLVSRDKDLDQLIGPHAIMYDPMKDEEIDAEALAAEKGYRPDQAVEAQALMGDSTDNVPGIPGVGPKTAAKLIAQYGSAEAVLEHADELSPKLAENVRAFAEQLPVTRELVTLRRDVPVELDLESMRIQNVRLARARPLFEELGFNRLLERLGEADGHAGKPPAHGKETDTAVAANAGAGAAVEHPARPGGEAGPTTAADFAYRCVDTPEGLAALGEELAAARRIAVDTETTSTHPLQAELVGVSLAWRAGEGVYVPVRGPLGATVLPVDAVRDALAGPLADERVEKVGHNLKYDLHVLRRAGLEVRGPLFDTMVAAHVLDSTRATFKLDALAMELLGHRCIPIEELIGRGRGQLTMDAVDVAAVAPYAAEDAEVALRLADVLAERLQAEGLAGLVRDLEMPLLRVLQEMEWTGVEVAPARLKEMEVELSKQADALRARAIDAAGRDFNPDSPKQLAEVLFEDLRLPVIKRRKTGPSTDSSVLEELAATHELPGLILDYRQLTKLLSTYLRALAGCIDPRTGRVHTSFHQAGTATGRLSSSDPNLQNIPIRTDVGRRIRSAFVAPAGRLLLSADYSQVELRVLAHLCGDETLTAAFHADQDIHRTVAAEVFHVPLAEVTAAQRARAKTVNFGIVYGQTAYGLARTLRIPRGEAAEFIQAYRQRFPQIDAFLQDCIAQAKAHGYVETILGRRRRMGEIDARNPQRRAAAERLAINSVVQGSAADLIKRAMVNIARRIAAERRPARMLLQIHDELVFEVPAEALDAERAMIVEEMTGAVELSVPLKVDVGVGANWMEAK